MRQIKFRFWNPIDKEWISNAMIEIDSKVGFFHLTGEEFIPCQFTGLLDKNGKEIYEGDILKVKMDGDLQDNYFTVDSLEKLYNDFNRDDSYYRFTEVEIIGNIYENPNLLVK